MHSSFKISSCKREDFMEVAVDFRNEADFSVFKDQKHSSTDMLNGGGWLWFQLYRRWKKDVRV